MLLVFTQDGVPTWEVSRRVKPGGSREDLIANGTADTFEAAKAAALFEARARSEEWGVCRRKIEMSPGAPVKLLAVLSWLSSNIQIDFIILGVLDIGLMHECPVNPDLVYKTGTQG
jgi:hypothetical protein